MFSLDSQKEKTLMEKLTALKDTYIKKSTDSSSTLPSTEKKLYKAGETIDVERVESAAKGHLKVTLGFEAGVWYIFEAHWSGVIGNKEVDGTGNIPSQAIKIITEFEGFVDHVYNDGVGVPTIGIGTTRYPDGRPVRFGDPDISKATAQTYLAHDLEKTVNHLASEIPYWSEMDRNRQSALISFAYNLGDFFYGDSSFNSITGVLKGKQWDDLPMVLELYSNPSDPVVHAGLLRRRKEEAELWQGKGQFAA
jgi:GH24 family phage-related lysozyme (muramidase)